LARADNTRTALDGRFGLRNVFALDRIDPKAEEASESFFCREETNVGLHERDIARKIENGIATKMMRLELVEIQKLAEEVGRRKAEATLEVSEENNKLTGFRHGFHLAAWKPARYLCRYPPGAVQPVDLRLRHI
jgi:hypothetical protein